MHDGDLVAVVSSGPSYIAIDPTYDKKMVLEAVGKIRGSGLIPAEIFKMLESSQGPGDIRARAQMAFYSAYNILGELEQVNNKRKAVIYISTGYDFDPFAEGRAGKDRIQGGRFSDPLLELIDEEDNPYFKMGAVTADIDLHKLMRELVLSANRANATHLHRRPARTGRRGRCRDVSSTRASGAPTSRRRRARCATWRKRPAAFRSSTPTTSSASSSGSTPRPATTTCSAFIRRTRIRPSAPARST